MENLDCAAQQGQQGGGGRCAAAAEPAGATSTSSGKAGKAAANKAASTTTAGVKAAGGDKAAPPPSSSSSTAPAAPMTALNASIAIQMAVTQVRGGGGFGGGLEGSAAYRLGGGVVHGGTAGTGAYFEGGLTRGQCSLLTICLRAPRSRVRHACTSSSPHLPPLMQINSLSSPPLTLPTLQINSGNVEEAVVLLNQVGRGGGEALGSWGE